MADIRFNIAKELGGAFGLQGLVRFRTASDQPDSPQLSYAGIDSQEVTEENVMSYLNTPVLFPITFKGGDYNIYEDGEIVQTTLEDLRLPLTAIAQVGRAKNKSTTIINGSRGHVTETYGHTPWRVRISGIIIPEPNHPQGRETMQAQLKALLEYEELVDSIKVQGDFFEMLKIYELELDNFEPQQLRGEEENIAFTLDCTSHEPIDLILQ